VVTVRKKQVIDVGSIFLSLKRVISFSICVCFFVRIPIQFIMSDNEDLSVVDLIHRIHRIQLEEVRLMDQLIVAVAARDNPQEGEHVVVAVARRQQGVTWTVSDFEIGDRVRIRNPNIEGQDTGVVVRKTAQRLVIRTNNGMNVLRSVGRVILLE